MKKLLIEMTMKQAYEIIDNMSIDDLDEDEKEVIFDKFLEAVPDFHDEILAHLEACIDWYVEDVRPEYLRELAEGRAENDAYERFRQKQIDGEV